MNKNTQTNKWLKNIFKKKFTQKQINQYKWARKPQKNINDLMDCGRNCNILYKILNINKYSLYIKYKKAKYIFKSI
jgi:hypothetical protein